MITALPDALGVVRPVTTSLPCVEALRLDSDKGTAVTLLNWSAKSIDSLEVIVRDVKPGAKVRSAHGVQLTAVPAGQGIKVTLSMPKVIDVLLIE